MVYLDTSFVAPLVIAENSSGAVEAFVLKVKPGELTTSMWTQVELSSLVSRKVRMGELSDSQAQVVRREFDRVLGESFEILAPTAVDFAAAAKYLEIPKTGLRAGDALHLAVAANHRAKRILTLDQGFLEAGKLLKLPVTRGIKA
jgi:predicted nucleic acid-binding protein